MEGGTNVFLKLQKHKKKIGALLSMEAMIYIVVVIIFTAMGIGGYRYLKQSARIRTAQADLVEIAAAVSHYHYDMGVYPTNLKVLTQKASDNYHGPWLGRLKKTPWEGDYQIAIDGSGTSARRFVVYCGTSEGSNGQSPGFQIAQDPDKGRLSQTIANGRTPTLYVFER